MPLYVFMCSACQHHFNRTFKIDAEKKPTCPNCGCTKIYRVFDSPPVIYKTNGFYSKDNKKK